MEIEDMITNEMELCHGYDSNYCDIYMCIDCGANFHKEAKVLKYEYHKQNNMCFKCHGLQIVSTLELNVSNFKSKTRTCNNCGGTGRYKTINQTGE